MVRIGELPQQCADGNGVREEWIFRIPVVQAILLFPFPCQSGSGLVATGGGGWRADRVARYSSVEGKGMGRMPMLRFGNWRGCGAPFGEIGPEKRLNQVEITEVQKGLHFLHQPGTRPQSE
jgi:hypothetical protein